MAASASINAPASPVAITPRAETATAALALPELVELEFELDEPELEPLDELDPEVEDGLADPVAVPLAAAVLLAGAALARFATLLHSAAAFALVSFWLYAKYDTAPVESTCTSAVRPAK